MFSMTTTELSTSIPTDTARPLREIMLMVTPVKYISTMAKITLMGMEIRVMRVGRQSRRNRNSTTTENSAPHSRDERMVSTIR